MRKLLVIALMLVLLVGCRKGRRTSTDNSAPPSDPNAQMSVHAPTGVVSNPGSGGGGGGGVLAVYQAPKRLATQTEMHDIHLTIENASGASGQMPTPDQVFQMLKQGGSKAASHVQDGSIRLTGTRSRETIWAYAVEPQVTGGKHWIVTASGVSSLTGPELNQRLQQEREQ